MKRICNLISFLALFVASICCLSCTEDKESFDISLLPGTWVSGTDHYRYDSDGKGVTWDTADDVSEEEGQSFTWSFNSETNALTLVHQMEMGGVVPKSYTLTALTTTKLTYKDTYGRSFSYSRSR